MSDKLLLEQAQGVATLSFNRPAVLNALDEEMISAFRAGCETVAADPDVRCVVLRGEGASFLAGGDVAMFARRLDALSPLSLELTRELHRGILALRRMPKPVVASVHGAVAGAGVSIAAACDLVLAADNARFVAAYSSIGTSPDGGSTHFLSRCMGPRRALEFLMLGDAVNAERAHELGLVSRVVPLSRLVADTGSLARRLADGPTHAFAQTKRLIDEAATTTLAAQLEAEAIAFAGCAASEDMREGVLAFVERRRPRFTGR